MGAAALVVERDVAGHDRGAEHLAGLRHAGDGLAQRVGRPRPLGVAEVQAVRDRRGLGAAAGDVERGLGDRLGPAAARIERDARAVAVERDRDRALRGRQPHDAGVAAGPGDRARADDLVVLLVDPGLGADVGRGQQAQQECARVVDGRHVRGRDGLVGEARRALGVERVAGRVGERLGGHVADLLVLPAAAQAAVVGDLADGRARQLPACADGLDLGEARGLDDGGHALLRLRDHDLERLHPGLAQRHRVELDLEPDLAARGHLRERRREPRGAEILQRDDERGKLERALEQLLARERVADLHRGALVGAVLVEILRGQDARPADAVAARGGAEEHDQVADARGARAHQLVGAQEADAERVDERVVAVGGVEDRLTADVRDTHAVAVAADAAHDPVEQPPRAILLERPEPQRVEDRDRPRAHGEDVAQDPAHAGRGALVGLDRGGVVVALDLEGDREAVADVDHAGVLTGPLQHAAAVRRQAPELEARVLVTAMLRPQQRVDGQLEVVRGALEGLLDLRVLGVRQPEGTMERLVGRLCHASTGCYRTRPSYRPSPRSGVGRGGRTTGRHHGLANRR